MPDSSKATRCVVSDAPDEDATLTLYDKSGALAFALLNPVECINLAGDLVETARRRLDRVKTFPWSPPAVAKQPAPEKVSAPQSVMPIVLGLVSMDLGVSLAVMLSDRHSRACSRARQIAMWILTQATDWSLPRIGRQFDRDHTTILAARDRINALRAKDPALRERTDRLLGRAKSFISSPQHAQPLEP